MSNEHAPTGDSGGKTGADRAVAVTGEDLDDLLDALADETRRRVLGYLDDADEDVAAFSDLVDHVTDGPTGDSPDDTERVAVNLHHNHLPKLSEANVVEYDPRGGTVRYRGDAVVTEWLELVRSHDSK